MGCPPHRVTEMKDCRLIFFHKQNTSARLRFLKLASGSVCAFEPLPTLSQMVDEDDDPEIDDTVVTHPAQLLREASEWLGLDKRLMKVEAGYHAIVDTNECTVHVYLTEFITTDPPFEHAQNINAAFIDLTQARDLPGVELELLRKAYDCVMTG